jgi:hypothetical protein
VYTTRESSRIFSAELKRQRVAVNAPLEAPTKLPTLPQAVSEAAGDSLSSAGIAPAHLRRLAVDAYSARLSPRLLPVATAALGAASAAGSSGSSFSEEDAGLAGQQLIDRLATPAAASSSSNGSSSSKSAGSAWEAELATEFAAGEGPVLQALGSYLRHLETDADGGGSQQEQAALAAAIAAYDLPATPDGCFPALFGRCVSREFCIGCSHCRGSLRCLARLPPRINIDTQRILPLPACRALSLGVVSRRRIYAEAAAILEQQPEQEQPRGFNLLRQLGWLLTSSGGAMARLQRRRKATAAAAAAEAKDFHEQMAGGREGR